MSYANKYYKETQMNTMFYIDYNGNTVAFCEDYTTLKDYLIINRLQGTIRKTTLSLQELIAIKRNYREQYVKGDLI